MFRVRRITIAAALAVVCSVPAVCVGQGAAGGAIQFSLAGLNGQTITAGNLRREVVVLAFGASWLPLSRNQLQGLKKLADDYAEHGVVVYWVSTEAENPKSKNYATNEQLRAMSQRYNLTVLRDPEGAVSRKLGVDQ